MSLLLKSRGNKVSGISYPPTSGSLFEKAQLSSLFESENYFDIADGKRVKNTFNEIQPDVVIHMAAQALVGVGVRNPLETYKTNVLGTINVLHAIQDLKKMRAALIVTTDKVYRDNLQSSGYIETDPLGATSPYAASKVAADIVTQSWISKFPELPLSIARGGNVIGGGDTGAERLFPQLVRAYAGGMAPELRSPSAIRPWQHVLDCIDGYCAIVLDLVKGNNFGEIWNVGPNSGEGLSVSNLTERVALMWPESQGWNQSISTPYEEVVELQLSSEKIKRNLKWENKLNIETSIDLTANWYLSVDKGLNAYDACMRDILLYEGL
jgi:CDP-glucose 4,6-dehydratase